MRVLDRAALRRQVYLAVPERPTTALSARAVPHARDRRGPGAGYGAEVEHRGTKFFQLCSGRLRSACFAVLMSWVEFSS